MATDSKTLFDVAMELQVSDPDGYRLDFESPTDVPEDTIYSDPK
jgi:hypothetical protein